MIFEDEKQQIRTQNFIFTSLFLTDREIDILACLYSGKTHKKTALILNLSPGTVKKHASNVMKKLDKHTRESVVEYIEKNSQGDYLTAYYAVLLKRYEFNKLCVTLAKKIGSQKKICHMVCNDSGLFQSLRQDLSVFGIKAVAKRGQTSVVSMTILTMFSKNDNSNIRPLEGCLIYDGDYYGLFWEVLEEIVIHPAIEEARLSFEETFAKDSSTDSLDKSEKWDRLDSFIDRLEATAGYQDAKKEEPHGGTPLPLWKRFKPLYYGPLAAFIVGCFALPVLQETSLFTTKSAVRSALSLPIDAYLLERPVLLSKIANAFKSKGTEKIPIVVLVGMGGMGKTTLARHYARRQSLPVIFELAAQDPKTLLSSFSKLAFILAETPFEKKELELWQQIENTKAHADKILPFVAQKLKEKQAKVQRWLLIFDNVDRFEDIESFLPQDPQVWGQGNILITTRNEHITSSDHIDPNHVITITPLSVEEQVTLFKKVLHRPLSKGEQKELLQFLTKLPPFPLDVMIAAHYIKRTKTSYSAYLHHLTEMHRQFEASQHIFLTRATSYAETRMAIISSAVKQIVAKDPAFIPLLWMISHLGGQPIPKDLLICAAGQLVVDRFVDELSHYSLLIGGVGTDHKGDNSAQILLHQSTQQNMRIYLQRTIDEKQKQRYNDSLIQALEGYCHQMMVPPIPLMVMKDFSGHLHVLLESQVNLLSPLHRSCVQLLLGSFYCYLVDSMMAKQFLDPSLTYLSSYYKNSPQTRLRSVFLFSGIAARLSGDYAQAKIRLEKSANLYERDSSSASCLCLATALRYLSYVYQSLSEYDKAKLAIERSVHLYTEYASHSLDLALAFSDLATVYYGGPGDCDKAVFYQLKSLTLLYKICGADYLSTLSVQGKLGMSYRRLGYYRKALRTLQTSYKGFKKNYPHNLDYLSLTATKLGEIYRLLGDVKQAELLLKEGVELAAKYFGKDHIYTDWGLIPLAQLYIDVGQYVKAKLLLEKSLKGHQKEYGDTHDKTISAHHPLGLVYAYLGEKDKALTCFVKSEASFAKHYGRMHVDYALFLKDFGLFYILTGNYDQAETFLTQALTVLEKAQHIERYRCFEYLGDLYSKKSKAIQAYSCSDSPSHAVQTALCKQADGYFQEALVVIQEVFPKESFHIARIRAKRSTSANGQIAKRT